MIKDWARTAGRNAVRAYGIATARWRPAPEFVIIGAKRSGTTSLFRYLGEHPQVAPMFPSARRIPMMRSDQKGVHYFESNHERGSRWYRSHFRTACTRVQQRGLPTSPSVRRATSRSARGGRPQVPEVRSRSWLST